MARGSPFGLPIIKRQYACRESVALSHRDESPDTTGSSRVAYTFKGVGDLSDPPTDGQTVAPTLMSIWAVPDGPDDFLLELYGASLTPNGFLWGATSMELGPCMKKDS